MAMPLAVHDILPSTSGQTQDFFPQNSATRNRLPNISYAEIANGKCSSSQNDQVQNCSAYGKMLANDKEMNNGCGTNAYLAGVNISSNAENEVYDKAKADKDCSGATVECSNQISQTFPVTVVSDASSTSFSPQISPATPGAQPDSKAIQYSRDVWQAAVENMERDNIIREKIGLIINKRYRVVQKISFGSYGSIYSAVDMHTNQDVAVKFEIGSKPASELHLKYENDVYHCMKGEVGVPAIHWFGSEYNHQILVMQLLGPSLEQLFSYCERHFNWNTIVSLADQMLLRIWVLHSRGYIHRDIKPENFLMGIGELEHICFLVDFGLARRYRYRDGNRLTHIPFRKGKSLVGTAKYASINSHNGLELSRRDDLESLGYIIIEFINRDLPWREQRSKARFRSKQQSYNRIRNMKEQADWNVACPKMAEWISYCQRLGFSEEPDYMYLRGLLQSLAPAEKRRSRGENFVDAHQPQTKPWKSFPAQPRQSPFATVPHTSYKSIPYYPHSAFEAQAMGVYKSPFGRSCEPISLGETAGNRNYFRRFDDGSKRYSWLMRRDSSPSQRYTFECLFRWTLPSGSEAMMPPYLQNNVVAFDYGSSQDYSVYGVQDRVNAR